MKVKKRGRLLSVVLAIVVTVTMLFMDCGVASAAIKMTEDGLQYEVLTENGGQYIEILDYFGESVNVIIPESIEGIPVTYIREYAFYGDKIESISGKNIQFLGAGAFKNCTRLKKVDFPTLRKMFCRFNSQALGTPDVGAFEGCTALEEVEFPKVIRIENNTFKGCTNLKKLYLPVFKPSTVDRCQYWYVGLSGLEEIYLDCSVSEDTLINGKRIVKRVHNSVEGWSPITSATCTVDGEREGTCTDCKESIIEVIPSTGHTFGDWTVTKKATCTNTGEKERTCTVCQTKETESIPVDSTAHGYSEWKVTRGATCSAVGEKARECTACGNKETEEVPIDSTAHNFINYTYNNDAKVGVDGTETAACDNGCGATDTRTKKGTALSSGGSFGGGGGYIPSITVQKPTISTGDGYTVSTGSDGTTATINVQDGYELVDVTVNGVSKGEVTTLTGLKTGDKVEVKVVKKEEFSEVEKVQAALATVTVDNFKARSKQVNLKNGKKAVKITWSNTSGVKFDGVEVFRSVKRYSGYGTKPVFSTEKDAYYNTAIIKGTKYYYKVRGYVEIDGVKYYTDWSKKAWRTVK